MVTIRTNTAIVRIKIPMAYLSEEYRIQEVSLGGDRVYISKGAAGGKSISIRNVEILACGVSFWPDEHFLKPQTK
jgi:hypothetical protein